MLDLRMSLYCTKVTLPGLAQAQALSLGKPMLWPAQHGNDEHRPRHLEKPALACMLWAATCRMTPRCWHQLFDSFKDQFSEGCMLLEGGNATSCYVWQRMCLCKHGTGCRHDLCCGCRLQSWVAAAHGVGLLALPLDKILACASTLYLMVCSAAAMRVITADQLSKQRSPTGTYTDAD